MVWSIELGRGWHVCVELRQNQVSQIAQNWLSLVRQCVLFERDQSLSLIVLSIVVLLNVSTIMSLLKVQSTSTVIRRPARQSRQAFCPGPAHKP